MFNKMKVISTKCILNTDIWYVAKMSGQKIEEKLLLYRYTTPYSTHTLNNQFLLHHTPPLRLQSSCFLFVFFLLSVMRKSQEPWSRE